MTLADKRTTINDRTIQKVMLIVQAKIRKRLDEKGRGAFIGPHESFGIISEEYHELIDAVRSNNGCSVVSECIDLASAMAKEDR